MKKTLLVVSVVAVLLVLEAFYYQKLMSRDRSELAQLQPEAAKLRADATKLQKDLASARDEATKLKGQVGEVHRLRGELASAKQALNEERKKVEALQRHAARQGATAVPMPTPGNAATKEPETLAEMAQEIGKVRAKVFSGTPLTKEEHDWLESLKPELQKLEQSPAEFAEFQTGLIAATVGIADQAKIDQIKQGIQKAFENLTARGLDITSRPQTDDADWVQQRHQVDRRATRAVQTVLTETERAAFDRAFIGVVGVDLGTGVDKTLYPPGFLGEASPPRPGPPALE